MPYNEQLEMASSSLSKCERIDQVEIMDNARILHKKCPRLGERTALEALMKIGLYYQGIYK